jgi:hypothetical protein
LPLQATSDASARLLPSTARGFGNDSAPHSAAVAMEFPCNANAVASLGVATLTRKRRSAYSVSDVAGGSNLFRSLSVPVMVSLTTLIALATRWPKVFGLDLRARFEVRLALDFLTLDFLAAGLRAFRAFETLVFVRFAADFLAAFLFDFLLAFLRAFFAIGCPPVLPINGPSIETRRIGRQSGTHWIAHRRRC